MGNVRNEEVGDVEEDKNKGLRKGRDKRKVKGRLK